MSCRFTPTPVAAAATADFAPLSRQLRDPPSESQDPLRAIQQVQYQHQLDVDEPALVGPAAFAFPRLRLRAHTPESASLLTTARTCAGVDAWFR